MIEFLCTPLHVRIEQQGCHGNHAISQGRNVFIFQKYYFLIHGVPRNNLAPMKNCHEVQGRSN